MDTLMYDSDEPPVPIKQVERETGITKQTLRKWESRYGFPSPRRDANGERLFDADDVNRLRLIKCLLDGGIRAGKVVPLDKNAVELLYRKHFTDAVPTDVPEFGNRVFSTLHEGNVQGLHRELETTLLKHGLNAFVEEKLPPLIARLGRQWEEGHIQIYQEHIFSEVLRSILEGFSYRFRGNTEGRRVLMGTLPDEQHGMGLIMLQSLLTAEGAQCINLGTQVPLIEIVRSAIRYRADIVAVSFSLAYTSRKIAPFILELRRALPDTMTLWAGGAGVDRLRSVWPGVRRFERIGVAARAIR